MSWPVYWLALVAFFGFGCFFLCLYLPVAFCVYAANAKRFSLRYLFLAMTAEALAIGICRAAFLFLESQLI
jgi:hypothetical protein